MQFGDWKYDEKANTLELPEYLYDIELDNITQRDSVYDWIFHVAQKPWITDAQVGQFVRALEHLLVVREWKHGERMHPRELARSNGKTEAV